MTLKVEDTYLIINLLAKDTKIEISIGGW